MRVEKSKDQKEIIFRIARNFPNKRICHLDLKCQNDKEYLTHNILKGK